MPSPGRFAYASGVGLTYPTFALDEVAVERELMLAQPSDRREGLKDCHFPHWTGVITTNPVIVEILQKK